MSVETSEDATSCSPFTSQSHTSDQQEEKMDVEQQAETEYSNHLEVSQGAPDVTADGGDVAADTVETNKKLPLGQYLRSGDFKEICCCIVFGILCMLTQYPGIPVNVRPIPTQELENSGDIAINLTYAEEYVGDTVSNAAVVVIGFVAPLILQWILCKTVGQFGDAHKTFCVYIVATGLVGVSTNAIKSYAGYLRPIFFDKCQPDEDYQECTNADSEDARKSFPSGHSSVAFSGMMLLTCYLLARFGVYSSPPVMRQGPDGTMLVQFKQPARYKRAVNILCLAPLALACWVAASRLKDNMHFPADVVGGSVLGASIAWFTHGTWFLSWPAN